MDEYTLVKQIDAWPHRFGGERHSGWLPAGAAEPLPTPTQDVLLRVRIESDGAGFLLVYESADGSIAFDTWHETLNAAEEQAEQELGIRAADWNG